MAGALGADGLDKQVTCGPTGFDSCLAKRCDAQPPVREEIDGEHVDPGVYDTGCSASSSDQHAMPWGAGA